MHDTETYIHIVALVAMMGVVYNLLIVGEEVRAWKRPPIILWDYSLFMSVVIEGLLQLRMNADPKVMLVFIIIRLIHNEIKSQLEKRLHKKGSDKLNESGADIQSN